MKKIHFDSNKNIISANLRKIRKESNMTQSQLAAKMQTMGVNIDQQMISKIENNTRMVTDYELVCLCEVFKVELKDMLSDFYEVHVKEP